MKIILSVVLIALYAQVDFYSLSFKRNDGSLVTMDQFRGKKVLIVTMASGSVYDKQCESLQSLQQLFRDTLVVIGVPSNSFGHEPKADSAIAAQMRLRGCNFILAAKTDVAPGPTQHPLFSWLSSKELNGRMGLPVKGDFNKYLVDRKGMVSAVFMAGLDPMDSVMKKSVRAPSY